MNDDKITVLLVEDHHVAMEGLRSWLEKSADFRLVGTASTAGAGLQIAATTKPTVTLLDLHLPDKMPVAAVIKELCSLNTKVLIFSAEDRAYFVQLAIQCGASGFISKQETYGTIANAIRDVCFKDHRFISACLKQSSERLTDVEKEIVSMLARGLRYEDIAARRTTSNHTVRKQCDRLQAKLRLVSREQLIAWAVTNGYHLAPLEPAYETLKNEMV